MNDNFIERHFMLSTIDSNVEDTYRFDRRKVLTPYSNKFDRKKYKKKLLNQEIYDYLYNRYSDSQSIQETLYRIHNKIEVRPTCVICSKEVEFGGLSGGFKDTCSKECHNKHRSQWCTIHEKHYHCPEITDISQVNDQVVIDFFFKDKTPKETGSLMNSYVMVETKENTTKHNLYNKYIYQYLKTRYDDCDYPPEVLYRIKNNINKKPMCEQCGTPIKFVNISVGYRANCSNRKCTEKLKRNRQKQKQEELNKYLEEHNNIIYDGELNDDVIINMFNLNDNKVFGQIPLLLMYYMYERGVGNNILYKHELPFYINVYEYLKNRFNDSQSLKETLYRIYYKEYVRPVCKECGKSVEFVGKPSVIWREFCSIECKMKYINDNRINFNNCKSISKSEIRYKKLIEDCGINVIQQYKTDEYPYRCDMYIPEFNLYIEFNGFLTHGLHPYRNNDEDNKYVNELLSNIGDWAIVGWTINDVEKRNIAKQNNLNYLELWGKDLGKKRSSIILDGLLRMRGKSDTEIRNIIKEISLYETIYDDNIYLG